MADDQTGTIADEVFVPLRFEQGHPKDPTGAERQARWRDNRNRNGTEKRKKNKKKLQGRRTPVEALLTGGGRSLPMVTDFITDPPLPIRLDEASPEIPEGPLDQTFLDLRPQLAVAIGGAVMDLPRQTAPVRIRDTVNATVGGTRQHGRQESADRDQGRLSGTSPNSSRSTQTARRRSGG